MTLDPTKSSKDIGNGKKRSHDEMSKGGSPSDTRNSLGTSQLLPRGPPSLLRRSMLTQQGSSAGGTGPQAAVEHGSGGMLEGQSAISPDARQDPQEEETRRPTLPRIKFITRRAESKGGNASIQDLRTQIIDNIRVLTPHLLDPALMQILAASRDTENTNNVHVVTLKEGNEWTAAWTLGYKYVIQRTACAPTAIEALELLLQETSESLHDRLGRAGQLRSGK